MTNLTYGILPSFFWTLLMPIMWLVSSFLLYLCLIYLSVWSAHVPLTVSCVFFCWTDPNLHQHIHAHTTQRSRGFGMSSSHCADFYFYSEWIINMTSCSDFSQHWLFLQKPESLDPMAKYHSLTSGLGTNYTQPRQVSNKSTSQQNIRVPNRKKNTEMLLMCNLLLKIIFCLCSCFRWTLMMACRRCFMRNFLNLRKGSEGNWLKATLIRKLTDSNWMVE